MNFPRQDCPRDLSRDISCVGHWIKKDLEELSPPPPLLSPRKFPRRPIDIFGEQKPKMQLPATKTATACTFIFSSDLAICTQQILGARATSGESRVPSDGDFVAGILHGSSSLLARTTRSIQQQQSRRPNEMYTTSPSVDYGLLLSVGSELSGHGIYRDYASFTYRAIVTVVDFLAVKLSADRCLRRTSGHGFPCGTLSNN